MFTKIILQIILINTFFTLNLFADSPGDVRTFKSNIYVSIPPLAYFVERVGGNDFKVVTVIGPGQSPATFETTPKQLARFSEARIFFVAGVPFEKQLNKKLKAAFEDLNIVDTQKGIKFHQLDHHHHGDIEHDNAEEENSLDPHTWLDPSLAKIIAQNIFDGLVKISPADSSLYRKNLNMLFEELDKIDSLIMQKLQPYAGHSFYTFHPAFGYLARAYNLKQKAIEVEGKEPSTRQLTNIITKAKKDGVKIIFTQPQFSDKSARAIAESVNARVIPIDPLSKDYINNLKIISDNLVLGFEGINNE